MAAGNELTLCNCKELCLCCVNCVFIAKVSFARPPSDCRFKLDECDVDMCRGTHVLQKLKTSLRCRCRFGINPLFSLSIEGLRPSDQSPLSIFWFCAEFGSVTVIFSVLTSMTDVCCNVFFFQSS